MGSTRETFQIMNDVEFILQPDSFNDNEKSFGVLYWCKTRPFLVANLSFAKVNEYIKMKPEVHQISELKSLQETFQDHTNRDPNRMFAGLSMKQQFAVDQYTKQELLRLHYIVNLNQNLVKSLGASGVTELRIQLRCYMEENRLGKWCQWDSTHYSAYYFALSVSEVEGTLSDENTLQLSKKIEKELEAIHLIREGKQTLRIRFNLDVSATYVKKFKWRVRMSSNTPRSSQPNCIKMTDLSILQSLYENDGSKDITIIVGNQVAVKAHKCILTAKSSVLEALLTSKMKERVSSIIHLEDIGEAAMNQLLRYLYGMEIPALDLNCEVACELFQAAHKYKLPQLEASIASVFLFRDEKWFTADIALELYFYTKNISENTNVHDHLLKVLSRIPSTKLRSCQKFKELPTLDVVDLTFKLNDALNLN